MLDSYSGESDGPVILRNYYLLTGIQNTSFLNILLVKVN